MVAAEKIEMGRRVLLTLLFCAFLLAPLVGQALKLDPAPPRTEKRTLANRPLLPRTVQALKEFPPAFESYYNDRFGFRNSLVDWNGQIKLKWFGESPTPSVVIGRDGWLFLATNIRDWQGTVKYPDDAFSNWLVQMEKIRSWLAERNIRLLVVIAPEKHSVYPEHLPLAARISRGTFLPAADQLMAYMKDHPEIPILDLRPVLIAAKDRGQLYHRTDTHWNELGAHVAYVAIMERLKEWYPAIEIAPFSSFKMNAVDAAGGDLAGMTGAYESWRDTHMLLTPSEPRRAKTVMNEPLNAGVITEVADPKLPHAVLFRDSFFEALLPYTSEHFRRAVYRWHMWFFPELVANEKPDVVIYEMVERNVFGVAPLSTPPK